MDGGITVQFVGRGKAVLAGEFVYPGQRRTVRREDYDRAERAHPGEWKVIGQPAPTLSSQRAGSSLRRLLKSLRMESMRISS